MVIHPVGEWAEGFTHPGNNGEAMVLIHGFTGHPGHWRPIAETLNSAGYTVAVPRLTGHGTNEIDLSETGATEWLASAAAAVAGVSEHRRIHLVGLSMGGMLAILLARPTGAASIVTINAPVITRDLKVLAAPLAHRVVPWTIAQGAASPDPELAHLWTPYARHPTRAVAELTRVVRRAWVAAARLRRPALVIQSRADETVNPRSGPLLAKRLDARLVWLDTSRHNAILDPARTEVVEAIIEHLTRLRPTRH